VTLFKKDPLQGMQELARTDGKLGQDHVEDAITVNLGLRQGFYPERSLEHALLLQESNTERLDRWVAELHATEEALLDHQPRWLLLTLVVVVFVTEIEAGIIYFKDLGLTGMTRLVMAAAAAGTTIFLPWLLVELAKQWKESK
jgi:hypothetical protein